MCGMEVVCCSRWLEMRRKGGEEGGFASGFSDPRLRSRESTVEARRENPSNNNPMVST
jgi:hypothetical protein